MPLSILDKLKHGIVLGDGGYLLALEKRGYVQAGPFTPEVTIEHPNALRALHEEFVHAGSEVLQVLAFYASENKLAQIGYANRLGEINRAAVRIAREVARAAPEPILVAGDLCLTWKYEPGSPASADECRRLFDDQIRFQMEEGVDFWVCETFLYVGEALLALERARKTKLPVMVTLAWEAPRTRDGKTPADAAKMLEGAGADVVGPVADAAGGGADAQGGQVLRGGATGRLPLHRRGAFLHRTERVPGQPRSVPADPL